MIDWPYIATNLLWILGLALLLTAWSYRKAAPAGPGRDAATGRSVPPVASLGLLLVCAGLGARSSSRVEQAVWAVLTLAVVVLAVPDLGRIWLRRRVHVGAQQDNNPIHEEAVAAHAVRTTRWGLLARSRTGLLVAVALLQGLLYVWLLPPWQHYDEPTHFAYAWLIANHGHLPTANEVDRPMQRAVLQSMIDHNFYRNLPKPNLEDQQAGLSLGFSELDHPPVYYIVVSVPLRLVHNLDITTQLYVARLVSLTLFVLTVVAAAGIASNLVPAGHALRWTLPAGVALFPALADIMTAVNNDAAAICLFTCFLWAAVRAIRRGLSVDAVLGLAALAILGPFVKNTAALTVLLLPLVVVLAISVQRGWRWRTVGWLAAFATVCLVVAVFGWGDAAGWYRWYAGDVQRAATRTQLPDAEGRYAVVIETRPHTPNRYLLNPIRDADLTQLAGQKVTIGGWLWADAPVTAAGPGLLASPKNSKQLQLETHAISVTTTPHFYSWTTTVMTSTGTLYYALSGSTDQPQSTQLYLRNPVLVLGTYPTDQPPTLQDGSTARLLWAGRSVVNMVRNSDATAAWPRLRPWVDDATARLLRRSPSPILDALLDFERSGPLILSTTAPFVLRGIWSRFAWGHVTIDQGSWPAVVLLAAVLGLVGVGRWLSRRHSWPSAQIAALLLLASATGGIWALTLAWPLPYRWALLTLPSARYALPSIAPLMLIMSAGWHNLAPERYRLVVDRCFVLLLLLLDLTATWTIWHFYRLIG